MRRAFTLIELLIVVAIIAILAAIAVPNFLEAQTRSKVSRAKADMRSIATGLESYYTDYNRYPDVFPTPGPFFNPPIKLGLAYSRAALSRLSTPISYLTNGLLTDPFAQAETATNFFGYAFAKEAADTVLPPPVGATSIQAATAGTGLSPTQLANGLARFREHRWVLQSVGPDRVNFALQGNATGNFGLAYLALTDPNASIGGVPSTSFFYDPTNGTVSRGDVIRTAAINIP